MERSRRRFLKTAGLAAAALGTAPVVKSLAAQTKVLPSPKAFKGQQWAMIVDMRQLTEEDIAAAVKACHTVHNVPQIPSVKEEIKWIWPAEYENAFPGQATRYANLPEKFHGKHFPLLCNHCENPPCCRVCPTKATFKRPEDGIVLMDFHRCIGCRFCMAACPFGARSFNFSDPRPYLPNGQAPNPEFPTRARGVVEKCNFCAERLAVGQVPACVEAVESGALVFGDLADPESQVRKLLRENFAIRRKAELGTGPNIYYIV